MNLSSNQPEGDKEKADLRHSVSADVGSRTGPTTPRPNFELPSLQSKKPRSGKPLAIAVAVALLAAGSWFTLHHAQILPTGSSTPVVATQSAEHQVLSFGAAQLDHEATDAAIDAIRSGKIIPSIAALSEQQKMEILTGERKFYRVPVAGIPRDDAGPVVAPAPQLPQNPTAAQPIPQNPGIPPSTQPAPQPPPPASDPQAPAPPAAPAVAPPTVNPAPDSAANPSTPYNSGKVRVDFDGAVYADYDLSTDLSSICIPVKNGDTIGVTCLTSGEGHRFVCFRIVDSVGPLESHPLYPGERQTWTYSAGTADYTQQLPWLQAEAANGNSIAEDGLGYVYEHGMGVAQDQSQALSWYRKAADQGNNDAQARLRSLGY